MQVICEGQYLDTADMIAIPVHVDRALGVYVTRDHAHVFAAYMYPGTGVVIIPVEGETLQRMAADSHDADLRKAADKCRSSVK